MKPQSGIPPVFSLGTKLNTIEVEGVTVWIVRLIGEEGVSPTITNPEVIVDSPAIFSAVMPTW